jgi:hypothetical protein
MRHWLNALEKPRTPLSFTDSTHLACEWPNRKELIHWSIWTTQIIVNVNSTEYLSTACDVTS